MSKMSFILLPTGTLHKKREKKEQIFLLATLENVTEI